MFGGIPRERDPNLVRFETEVFGALKEMVREEDERVGYIEIKSKSSMMEPLSFEDAIKELIEIEKGLK
jgi:hypothetical protein